MILRHRYRNYTIERNPKPIPDFRFDWDFWHDDHDEGDNRHGNAASLQEAVQMIDEIEEERNDYANDESF